jgi:hypothetical protein
MLWMMLAAQLSAPPHVSNHVPDVRALFSYTDVPDYLVRLGEVSRTVYTRTTVRDDGSVQNCVAEVTSGDTKLDAYTCTLIVKRAKFVAATWVDGTPVYSVLRFPVNWTVTESIPPDEDRLKAVVPDLELSVSQLPKGAPRIVDVTIEVTADRDGRIVSCAELPPNKRDPHPHFADLVPIACEQAEKSLSLSPPLDGSGKPTRSVQTASVRLMLDH